MPIDFITSALVTLLVTLDPPGLAPIFLSLTQGMSVAERRQVAIRACIIAFGILAFFGVAGDIVLKALGVSLPAFRIAGGLLLFWIAFEMVFERRTERKQQTATTAITQDHIRNVAAFPLAIPLMAGPGALTAIILLAGRAEGDPLRLAALAIICGLVILSCLAVFWLLGVILAALAVQFVIDGVRAVVRAG